MRHKENLKIKDHIFEDWMPEQDTCFIYKKCKICNHIIGTGNVGDDWFNSLISSFMIRNPQCNVYRIPFCLECIMDDAIG